MNTLTKYPPDVQKTIEAINQQINAHRSMANSLASLKQAIIEGDDFSKDYHADIYAHELQDLIKPHVEKAMTPIVQSNANCEKLYFRVYDSISLSVVKPAPVPYGHASDVALDERGELTDYCIDWHGEGSPIGYMPD